MTKIYKLIQGSFFCFVMTIQFANAQFANGLIISNEGNFGIPNADVSYLDQTTFQVTNNVFQTVNNEALGDVLQHIGFYEDKAFLVLNNSNKVVVVDRESFQKLDVITQNVSLPRSVTFANSKVYVANSNTNSVSVYDAENHHFITEIQNLGVIDEMLSIGNFVFVQNGFFGTGNNIIVIDSSTDTVVENISVAEGINGLAKSENHLFAVSSTSNQTNLYKIDPNTQTIVNHFQTSEIVNAMKIRHSENQLFFVGNVNNVFKISDDLSGEPQQLLSIENTSWSAFYGFGVAQEFVFSSDVRGFTSASLIQVFDKISGLEIAEFSVGIGANGFYENIVDALNTHDSNIEVIAVQVYPNPAQEFIALNGVAKAKIQIYNALGQRIREVGYQGQRIYVGDLNQGLYYLNIQSDDFQINKKLLIK